MNRAPKRSPAISGAHPNPDVIAPVIIMDAFGPDHPDH